MDEKIVKAKELCPSNFSLYRGKKEAMLSTVAPYVFDIAEFNKIWDWFFDEGWSNSWGVVLYTTISIKQIRKHLRRFLIVITEDKKELLFRFYDPRVLRIFLPTCDAQQLQEFFGPIDYFVCEDENPEMGLVFSLENNKLVTKSITKEEVQQFNPERKKKRFSFF